MDRPDQASDGGADGGTSEGDADFAHSIATDIEYETIFDAIEDGVFVFDVERDDDITFRFQWNNRAHEASTGMTAEEYHGQTPREILGEEEGAEVAANYAECVERQETITYEEQLDHPSGTVEWSTKLTPVIEDGTVEQIVGVARDITERKEQKRTLEKRETHLRQAQSVANLGSWQLDLETDELHWSEEVYDLFGVPRDESLTYERFLEFVHPEDREYVDSTWNDALEVGEYDIEHRIVTGDGEVRWVRERGDVEFDDDGTPVNAFGVVQDVTERKERERELDRSRERLRRLFDEAPDGIVIHDVDGNVLDVNDTLAEMLGYSPDELRSMTVPEFEIGVDEAELRERWASMDASAMQNIAVDGTHQRSDGSTYPVEVWVSKIVDDESDEARFMALARDVSERKKYETELRKREEKYRSLFSESRDALMLLDEQSVIECNQAAVDLFGAESPTALSGCAPWELSPPTQPDGRDSEAASREHVERAFNEGSAFFEWTHERVDGTEFVAEVKLSRFEVGEEQLLHALVRDVTERKERERELRRFEAFVENSPARMVLLDTDGTVKLDRHSVETDWDHPPEEFLEENLFDYIHPEDRDRVREVLNDLHGSPGESVSVELRIRGRDGEWYWISTRAVDHTDDPLIDGILTVSVDITDRKEYEQELERYRDLVENVPVGIYRSTPGETGEFVEANPAMVEIFDAESETQLLDQPVRELYAEPIERREFSQRLESEGVVTEIEREMETLSGERFWAAVTAVARETNGETYFDGTIQEITERKEYERRLEEQRDNLEILNQVVRHDIRNDLQLVGAYAELLEDHVEGEGEEYLETVLESAESAVDLTTTARELAEVMLQPDVENRGVPVGPAVEQQIEEVRSTYSEAAVTVDGTLPGTTVVGNDMLGSVFRNLLKNAIEHNDKDVPEVSVSVGEQDDNVTVHVADNGPGIPDAQKDEIFGKGEKGLESEGTGIGLYLVQSLVDGYGGDVRVEDNDPHGAVFVVELPIAD